MMWLYQKLSIATILRLRFSPLNWSGEADLEILILISIFWHVSFHSAAIHYKCLHYKCKQITCDIANSTLNAWLGRRWGVGNGLLHITRFKPLAFPCNNTNLNQNGTPSTYLEQQLIIAPSTSSSLQALIQWLCPCVLVNKVLDIVCSLLSGNVRFRVV